MKKWTADKIEQLRQLWQQGKSDEEIAAILNTTAGAVERQRTHHGFVKFKKQQKRWTTEEVELLKKLAPDHTCTEIANILGRSFGSVQEKAQKLYIEIKRERNDYHYVSNTLSKEYRNMGDGPHRGYTTTTDMLIMQYLSEGYSLAYIATELGRDYKSLQRYCSEHQDRLREAHKTMMNYDSVYARRLQRRKEAIV